MLRVRGVTMCSCCSYSPYWDPQDYKLEKFSDLGKPFSFLVHDTEAKYLYKLKDIKHVRQWCIGHVYTQYCKKNIILAACQFYCCEYENLTILLWYITPWCSQKSFLWTIWHSSLQTSNCTIQRLQYRTPPKITLITYDKMMQPKILILTYKCLHGVIEVTKLKFSIF
jgi:hypothetical protein